MTAVGVLKVGGTHVTAALLDPARPGAPADAHRDGIDSQARAGRILADLARAAATIAAPTASGGPSPCRTRSTTSSA